MMKTTLKKYKRFAISLQQLKSVLGEDLYNVADVTSCLLYTSRCV